MDQDQGRGLTTCEDQERHCLVIINDSISRIDLNSIPACPSPITEAIKNSAAEGSEQVTERHSSTMLWPLFSLVFCVPASPAPVEHV